MARTVTFLKLQAEDPRQSSPARIDDNIRRSLWCGQDLPGTGSMRTFLRVSLLGNALIDLACILFLLHSSGNHPPHAAFSWEPAEEQAAVDSNNLMGVFPVEAPSVHPESPGSYPAVLLDGHPMPAELVQLAGTPRYTTAYEVGWLNWRSEGQPLDTCLGQGASPVPFCSE